MLRRAGGSLLATLATVTLAGCLYSFVGGGLPSHIRTIAIAEFENATLQPLLESDVRQALQDDLPGSLGVRLTAEETADALLRGRITRYNESSPTVRRGDGGAGVDVLQQQIQLSFEVEIYDVNRDRVIWQGSSLSASGDFQPDQEDASFGRQRAIEELVQRIVDGAQSDW